MRLYGNTTWTSPYVLSCFVALREKGLIRSEGKDYAVQDGDVCFFKFSPPSK